MTASILEKPVSRGKLWGAAYTWSQAIKSHAEASHNGCCRFIVTETGIWIEGDDRHRSYRTKLPKGAESHARARIAAEQLVQSSRDLRLWVSPRYA
ncbi:MAG: hypothetical protein AAFV45_16160 [Pseudomonadota bacterium]